MHSSLPTRGHTGADFTGCAYRFVPPAQYCTCVPVAASQVPEAVDALDEVLDMAKRCHVSALEVISGSGNRQIDPMNCTQADADSVNQKLAERGLEISALSDYVDAAALGKTDEVEAVAKKVIDAAALLGVPTICMITGLPHSGMSRIAMIKQVIPRIFRPIVDHAKDKGIQVAIENWFATCLQGIDTFDCLLETFPDLNFGLNYDRSRGGTERPGLSPVHTHSGGSEAAAKGVGTLNTANPKRIPSQSPGLRSKSCPG